MPGLRENLHERLSHELVIDNEFQALIPLLTPDEFAGLEASILSEGCRDALIIWGNIIIDGHNRYKICTAHNIPYRTESKDFASRDEAILWMLQNKLSRRNLNDFQRVEIVRKLENTVKAKAKKRMLAGKTDTMEIFLQGRARDILGNIANISGKTYERAVTVIDNAPKEIIQAVRNDELSINSAYEVTNLPQEIQQDILSNIAQGKSPRKVVNEAKKQHRNFDIKYWNALIRNAEKAAKNAPNIDYIINIVNKALEILKSVKETKS